jgi:hypothetical protein
MMIKGRSIPNEAEDFWTQVLEWFDDYATEPCQTTVVKIDLEYFNISSSKQLLHFLYKLNEMNEGSCSAKVEWYYREDDLDMYEVGQDYAFMVKVPFEFIQQNQFVSEIPVAV